MNTPLRTILCPSDLSPTGDAAVAAAFALVARGGTVHLVHVWEPAYVLSPLDATPVVMLPSSPEQDAAHEEAVRSHLLALVPKGETLREARAPIDVVKDSNPVDTIVREAERLGADAIVMGTHGRSGLGRVFMGSIAADVLKRSKVPVILVSDPSAKSAKHGESSKKSPKASGKASKA